ncbi:MAG: hypothetical protein EO766_17000 [Hydrotalea sp. AMD]|uniref:3TM-type holin n=1 Tax=Hydrotalea sp. AMD TaxID=2501297 RepID=UPI0010269F08|nr:3TM-type holin [Hydrotalea sp. AMD]RWZ84884.1 MAG: hypothetical protein EO766_17000 [Hydrotalea sp. AMD]
MNPLLIQALITWGSSLIDKFIPDTNAAAQAKLDLLKASQEDDFKQVMAQIDVNAKEAQNPSLFVAGGRPFVIWVGGVGLACAFIPKALVMSALWTYQAFAVVSAWHGVGPVPALPVFPDLGLTDLFGLLGSVLGIGVMRSVDKFNGVDTKKVK